MSERISHADEDGNTGAKPITLLDRMLGAMLAFFGVALTLALAPVVLSIEIRAIAAFQHPAFLWRLPAFFVWGALWIVPATIAGWIAGFPRVLLLFSYVWFTADPPNRQLSLRLWCAIVIVCAFTSLAIWPF